MSGSSVRVPRRARRPLAGDLHTAPVPVGAVLVVHGFKGFKDWGFFPYLCEAFAGRVIERPKQEPTEWV